MIKLFFDTEFTGLHQNTTLISIGIIDEFENTFYAEFTDYDRSQLNDWLQENVIKNLILKFQEDNTTYQEYNSKTTFIKGTKDNIVKSLKIWLKESYPNNNMIEVWSDCLSYDWVLFNQLFENNLPKNIYYIPFDICTLFKIKNIDPDISREEFTENKIKSKKHNSLHDALVIKECYDKLIKL